MISKRHRRIFNDDSIFILSINRTNRMLIKLINISTFFAIMTIRNLTIKTINQTIKNIDQIQINSQPSLYLRRKFVFKLQSIQLLFRKQTRQVLTF